ncbi:MAG: hypothetical protein LKK00_05760 [Intestinimonas sp.]|jgi:hypothetical protein|nr:hypothetical protein [Intestinimonas sp.]
MSKRISFEEIGSITATFFAASGVKAGQVVKVSGNGTAAPCADGDKFCGVALSVSSDGFTGVQVGGFTTLPAENGGIVPGWAELCADGSGGVKTAASGAGREYLVVSTDAAAGTVTICL